MNKTIVITVSMIAATIVVASEIIVPASRVTDMIATIHGAVHPSVEVLGIDFTEVQKFNTNHTPAFLLEVFQSIDPEKVKLDTCAPTNCPHASACVHMVEPRDIKFYFQMRPTGSQIGPPSWYYLIGLDMDEDAHARH